MEKKHEEGAQRPSSFRLTLLAFIRRNRHHHRLRGVEKLGNLLLVFHFSIRRKLGWGNVGISPAFGEISKGLVESVGSLV